MEKFLYPIVTFLFFFAPFNLVGKVDSPAGLWLFSMASFVIGIWYLTFSAKAWSKF